MSSILTFSNRSVKLFTLKNRFLITAKVLHSIRMCLTVQVVWHVKHWLWFLFQNERLSKPCMTNSQLGYNNLCFVKEQVLRTMYKCLCLAVQPFHVTPHFLQ